MFIREPFNIEAVAKPTEDKQNSNMILGNQAVLGNMPSYTNQFQQRQFNLDQEVSENSSVQEKPQAQETAIKLDKSEDRISIGREQQDDMIKISQIKDEPMNERSEEIAKKVDVAPSVEVTLNKSIIDFSF